MHWMLITFFVTCLWSCSNTDWYHAVIYCMCVCIFLICGSLDSAVGIVTGYWPNDGGVGVRVQVGSIIFAPCRADCLWDSPSFLSNWFQGFFSQRKSNQNVKLTTHLHLALSTTEGASTYPLPSCVTLNSILSVDILQNRKTL
jgi:hypothetical protein